jgi:hypothetical protein
MYVRMYVCLFVSVCVCVCAVCMYVCIYECIYVNVYHTIIIIVVIIRHELCLDRPVLACLIVSKFFQVVFFHLVYNSALYSACCCSSFLLHVVANFVCNSFFSSQLFLLSTVTKFRQSCCNRTVSTQLF